MTLNDLLIEKRMTAYELSKQSGYPMSCCYRLCTGERDVRNISIQSLMKIADVLTDGKVDKLLKLLSDDVK